MVTSSYTVKQQAIVFRLMHAVLDQRRSSLVCPGYKVVPVPVQCNINVVVGDVKILSITSVLVRQLGILHYAL